MKEVTSTHLEISSEARSRNALWATKFRLKLLLTSLGLSKKGSKWRANINAFRKRVQYGRLTEGDIAELVSYQHQKVDKDFSSRSKVIQDEKLSAPSRNLNPQELMTTYLLGWLDRDDLSIHSIVNIGARVDVISSYLALKYPEKDFISVDLQENLDQHNSELPQSSNWRFRSGYALDMLEQGDLCADLIFMTSTSVLFNNKELELYLVALSRCTRYLVMNEPWWPALGSLNPMKTTKPEEVAPEKPFCSGIYGNYHHNYPVKLKRAGFRMLDCRLVETGKPGCLFLQIFAERMG